jgi:hypothetical protein
VRRSEARAERRPYFITAFLRAITPVEGWPRRSVDGHCASSHRQSHRNRRARRIHGTGAAATDGHGEKGLATDGHGNTQKGGPQHAEGLATDGHENTQKIGRNMRKGSPRTDTKTHRKEVRNMRKGSPRTNTESHGETPQCSRSAARSRNSAHVHQICGARLQIHQGRCIMRALAWSAEVGSRL